jgi:aspartate/methionine/tyrosine aminotransferase
MHIEKAQIFDWLLKNMDIAQYNLALSNIEGVSYEEFRDLTGLSIPDDSDLGMGEHYGNEELVEALCGIYHCGPENVVTASGGTEANMLVYMALLESGCDFLMERPGYEPMGLTPELLGARRIAWPRRFEECFDIDIESLRLNMTDRTRVVQMTNLHNPSGRLADRESVRAAAEIIAEKDAYLMLDEIFLDGAFEPQRSAFGLNNVMITSSMTKVYGIGGVRTGWVIAPEYIAKKCQVAKSHTTAASSGLGEWLNAKALALARDRLLERFGKVARRNHAIVKEWVLANPELVEWVEPDGGIICFPRYKGDVPSEELCSRLLDEYGVLLIPGLYSGLEGHFRLSYQLPEEGLRKALEALERGLREILR